LTSTNPDRLLPSRRLIRQQLEAGRLGEPGLVRSHHWTSDGGDPFDAIRHDVDVAIWLIGRAPNVVYAIARAGSCQLHLGFPGGPMALIERATDLPAGDGYRSLSVIGSCGAAYADDHQNVQLLYRGGPARAVLVPETSRMPSAVVDGAPDDNRERAALVVEAARESAAAGRAVTLELT
jgi:predicted dehydrogenase